MRIAARKILQSAGFDRGASEWLSEAWTGSRRGELVLGDEPLRFTPESEGIWQQRNRFYPDLPFGCTIVAALAGPVVLAHHKPTGIVTSRVDDGGTSVFASLPWPHLAERVEPVGRLDVETTGLLLFTDDGELLHRLTHPKREVERSYEATLRTPISAATAERLMAGGITLRDGHVPAPRNMQQLDAEGRRWRLTLIEGKYHEVRRMMRAVEAPVIALERVSYATQSLASVAAPGSWRRLDAEEVTALYASVSAKPGTSAEGWLEL